MNAPAARFPTDDECLGSLGMRPDSGRPAEAPSDHASAFVSCMQEAQQESEQQAVQPATKQRRRQEPELLPAKLEEADIVVPLDLPPACDGGDFPAEAGSTGDEPTPAQGLTPLATRQGQQAASPAASDDANTPQSQQGELMQRTRGMIAAETEAAMAPLLAAQSDVALAQWLVKLQGTLADEVKRHKEAQRRLKQVSRHC